MAIVEKFVSHLIRRRRASGFDRLFTFPLRPEEETTSEPSSLGLGRLNKLQAEADYLPEFVCERRSGSIHSFGCKSNPSLRR